MIDLHYVISTADNPMYKRAEIVDLVINSLAKLERIVVIVGRNKR